MVGLAVGAVSAVASAQNKPSDAITVDVTIFDVIASSCGVICFI
jgi:hypothetical protein